MTRRWGAGLAVIASIAGLALAVPPVAGAADPDPIEGQRFTRVVATFPPPIPTAVTVDWRDGQTSLSTPVTLPNGKGEVTASHTYALHGSYSPRVTDNANSSNYESTSITVKDAPISADGTTFPVAAAPGGVVLARITDQNPLGRADALKARIDWGDGTIADGTITPVAGQPGRFEVRGAHPYPNAATYLVGVTVTSNDGGDARADALSTAEGKREPDPPDTGRILDMGRGDDPSMAVDADGTAYVVWTKPAPGHSGDALVFCVLPRGARACKVKRTFQVDAFQPPIIRRTSTGTLYVVMPYGGTLQIGGGTLLMRSEDDGATWKYDFYYVNAGIFEGPVIDAALSQNGRFLYALFGDYVPGDKMQELATIGLDRATFGREDNPGKVAPPTGDLAVDLKRIRYSVRSIGVLPDGRVVIAGWDTDQARGVPRAAVRVIADGDGNAVSTPWTPIRAGLVFKLGGSPRGAAVLTSIGCRTGVEISTLRGLRVGAPRPLGSEGFAGCGPNTRQDLFIDPAGGRHVVWLSDHDGCQGSGPYENDRTCLIYRRARPGGDFGAKTTIANPDSASGVRVATAPDGEGWVAWRELPKGGGGARVRITPTFTSSEEEIGKHRIALTFTPGSECAKRDPVTIGVRVSGPVEGRPRIRRVTWSTTLGFVPRRQTDSSSPFVTRLTVDRRLFRGLSSTGTIVFSMTVRAAVRYGPVRGQRTANLSQVLSFYCGIPFSRVR